MSHRICRVQSVEIVAPYTLHLRFSDGAENKLFSVTFDTGGRVTASGTTIDPKENAGR